MVENEKDLETCPCREDVEDVSICCEKCEQWWHCSCVNLKGLTARAAEDFHDWMCTYCFVSAFESLFGADIEKPIEAAVKAEVIRVIPGIIKAVVQETVKENICTKTFADVIKAKHGNLLFKQTGQLKKV